MVEAQYIESGTFVTGEEEVFNAGIERRETVAVLKRTEYDALKKLADETERQIEMRFKNRAATALYSGGPKVWEQQLLHLAKVALGKPSTPPKKARW